MTRTVDTGTVKTTTEGRTGTLGINKYGETSNKITYHNQRCTARGIETQEKLK